MIHIVYPNASERENKFLGCGRLVVSESQPKGNYQRFNPINNPGILAAQIAVPLFAPESVHSRKQVYEEVSPNCAKFQGASASFAYFLALVNRSRRTKLSDDFWCTGAILCHDGVKAILTRVQDGPFLLKLKEFASEKNHNTIFFVSDQQGLIVSDIEQQGIRYVKELTEFQNLLLQKNSFTQKTIVVIKAAELGQLVDIIFEKPIEERIEDIRKNYDTAKKSFSTKKLLTELPKLLQEIDTLSKP